MSTFKRKISLVLTLSLIMMSLTFNFSFASSYVNLTFLFKDDDAKDILDGSKNVKFNTAKISMDFDKRFMVVDSSKIKIKCNNEDENYKFNFVGRTGGIDFILKDHYNLKKQSLYSIYIPNDAVKKKDADIYAQSKTIYFVTNTDEGVYKTDILRSVTPANDTNSNEYKDSSIVFEFASDIEFVPGVEENINDYIKLESSPITKYIDEYYKPTNEQSDSLSNYDIKITDNKLILESKYGRIKGFANYKLQLKDKTVRLKDAKHITNYSDYSTFEVIEFKTDKMIESTYPTNNQEFVEVEPDITFEFKYDIDIVDIEKIHFKDYNANRLHLNRNKIFIKDGNKLVVRIGDSDGKYPLKKNHLYTFVLEEGAVKLKEHPISNYETLINFITQGEGDVPYPTKYSSDDDMSDDITTIDDTKLAKDGYIYVKMNEDIRFDKDFDYSKNFKLSLMQYVLPNQIKQTPDGVDYGSRYDYRYNANTIGYHAELDNKYANDDDKYANLREIPIAYTDLDIVNGDTIRIKLDQSNPKTMYYHSRYKLLIDKYIFENMYGYNPNEDIEFEFFTDVDKKDKDLDWRLDFIKADAIEESKDAPYKSYILRGVPTYTKYKGDNTQRPLVVNVLGEVILNPRGYSYYTDTTINPNPIKIKHDYLDDITFREINRSKRTVVVDRTYATNLTQPEYKLFITDAEVNQDITLDFDSELETDPSDLIWTTQDASKVTVSKDGVISAISDTNVVLVKGWKNGKVFIEINLKVERKLATDYCQVEYYYDEDGNKNTKILLYPNKDELDYGKRYTLDVPKGTFVSRDGSPMDRLNIEFITNGDLNETIGIEKLEGNILNIEDLFRNKKGEFYIHGYNFNEAIQRIELIPVSGSTTITVPKKHIYYQGLTKIKVVLKDEILDQTINQGQDNYKVKIVFKSSAAVTTTDLFVEVVQMGAPVVLDRIPDTNETFDELDLEHDVDDNFTKGRYFMKIIFDDPDGSLEFVEDDMVLSTGLQKLMTSRVTTSGSTATIIDTDFINNIKAVGDLDVKEYINKYLFVKDVENKRATLYIPVKVMRASTSYNIIINSSIVRNYAKTNEVIRWDIKTQNVPIISDVITGSIIEDYDDDKPVIIKGDNFSENSRVYLNDEEADDVDYKEIEVNGVTYKFLYIYLPDDLDPGIYTIRVKNDQNHEAIEYGAFSIVQEGDFVPDDYFEYLDEVREGIVKKDSKLSEGIIDIEKKYNDDSELEFDLDELMGLNTYIRKLSIEGDEDEYINSIKTYSKWADIEVRYAKITDEDYSDEFVIYLGRVEDNIKRNLSTRLNKIIKSEFIQVRGENFDCREIRVSMPIIYKTSPMLRVYRYDESLRVFEEIRDINVDMVNKKVSFTSYNQGIFVVVEE